MFVNTVYANTLVLKRSFIAYYLAVLNCNHVIQLDLYYKYDFF